MLFLGNKVNISIIRTITIYHIFTEMFDRYGGPTHMFTSRARAS